MGPTTRAAAAAALLLSSTVVAAPAVSNSGTSMTLIYQNNLNTTDDVNHIGAIVLDPMMPEAGAKACAAIGETLLTQMSIESHSDDFLHSLAYLSFAGHQSHKQQYLIQNGALTVGEFDKKLNFAKVQSRNKKLPVLCTQSSNANTAVTSNATASNQLTVSSGGNKYVGFRNQKSFRFNGIPYAKPPARFEYSTLYDGTGETIQATKYGSDCVQVGRTTGGEQCLFLNIQTPYLPKAGSKKDLRPVLFSIHGGGFTGGDGGPTSGEDSGNFASREDIVGVEINYRLSTLGFLAIPGTDIKGNFGIGDQIVALEWVKKNIAQFGGDPNRVTIIGGSAGAGSVRTLLGSPRVINQKLIAGAIPQSNLGGGRTLGLDGDYGTTYSSYYTVNESYAVAGQQIFRGLGCNQTSLDAQIECLKDVPAQTIQNYATVARYVVQDGTIVNTPQLIVSERNSSTAHVPVMFGTTTDDGASFSNFPPANISDLSEGIQASLGITAEYAQLTIDSGLFPFYDTGNLTLDAFNVSQRIATDKTFRCIDEATVYAGAKSRAFDKAYYYNLDRTYGGYDPNNLGASGLASGPVTAGFPNGNPNLPYFRLHGADVGFTYGNQQPLRDANDLKTSQLMSGYIAAFTRTGDPNPPMRYLEVRGYNDMIEGVRRSGPWLPVRDRNGPAKNLDWPAKTIQFPDLKQCTFLNYTISYYLDGGM
ncbi:hypothetical protein WHR41_02803 [Cladosporium halotolerans]|uniref:Carboxylesterase type B domain-containing protein n=1 Tax=Cladosporium halotolerans TaxID=1052096 RepID=A0AB34KTH5_9PEZI